MPEWIQPSLSWSLSQGSSRRTPWIFVYALPLAAASYSWCFEAVLSAVNYGLGFAWRFSLEACTMPYSRKILLSVSLGGTPILHDVRTWYWYYQYWIFLQQTLLIWAWPSIASHLSSLAQKMEAVRWQCSETPARSPDHFQEPCSWFPLLHVFLISMFLEPFLQSICCKYRHQKRQLVFTLSGWSTCWEVCISWFWFGPKAWSIASITSPGYWHLSFRITCL